MIYVHQTGDLTVDAAAIHSEDTLTEAQYLPPPRDDYLFLLDADEYNGLPWSDNDWV